MVQRHGVRLDGLAEDALRVGFRGARQDDRELVAADARDRVDLAQAGARARRHRLQHCIAREVAMAVVRVAEAVDVHDPEGKRLAAGGARG
jgi:hypothetical protein